MDKIVLIDGNNLMFRSYYATSYTGNLMKNSKGVVTNALYGFATMINKIIKEENPSYMLVAFDIGKSFRHREYKDYKAGRNKTPDELKSQMPLAKVMLEHMGIKSIGIEDYEADDIIGTLAKRADEDPSWNATIITSDHDYLQLITDIVEVKLLKSKDFTRYKPANFKEEYGIDPIKVIDLKALMGDSSDNIPGVPGVGEKTALKLLVEYGSLDGVYEHIGSIKGKLQERLIENKDSAYFSKKLATIYRDVPIPFSFEEMKYNGPKDSLNDFYRDLEFYSLMNNFEKKEKKEDFAFKNLESVYEIDKNHEVSYYIECDNENYHNGHILGMGLYDGKNAYFVKPEMINDIFAYLENTKKYTFDVKKNYCLLENFELNTIYDLNLIAYLLNKAIKDDIAILMNNDGYDIPLIHDIIKKKISIEEIVCKKAKYIYDTHEENIINIKSEDMYELYEQIELPLSKVLARMEYNGIRCDANILNEMQNNIETEIDDISKKIYELVGEEFNISSPIQLSEILFEKLNLPHGKKLSRGYKTDAQSLEKLINYHPVIEQIIKYRNLTKLNSTYLKGLKEYIHEDGKIHTIYKQTQTRTGRLSSADPNLQNIPTRNDLGKMIRKAFVPEKSGFLSCDYSQIELRILAHLSKSEKLIEAFKNGDDIHTKVASDIFSKPMSEVTKQERRTAKAVIFGIVYGISGFGLGENIGITPKEAKEFINKYLEIYPGVKQYMDLTVKDAYECGYVRTMFKRKRNIDELFNTNYMIRQGGERIALNTPIQGSSADIIKKAMIEIDESFIKNNIKSKMLLQIHDELVFDIEEGELETVKKIVKEIMEHTVNLLVPLEVSTDFGTDLYETK